MFQYHLLSILDSMSSTFLGSLSILSMPQAWITWLMTAIAYVMQFNEWVPIVEMFNLMLLIIVARLSWKIVTATIGIFQIDLRG